MKDFTTLIQVMAPIIVSIFTYKLSFEKSTHDELKDVVDQLNKENEVYRQRITNANKKIEKLQQEIEDLKNEKH